MAPQNNKRQSLVPQHVNNSKQAINYLNKKIDNSIYNHNGNNAKVLVSLRFIQEEFECLSEWNRQEMRSFYDFNRQIHQYTWQQILTQGGKQGNKVGFAYTTLPRKNYPGDKFKAQISPDVDFFELRVNQRIRVHGFRDDAVFYLCWLDRNHSIAN